MVICAYKVQMAQISLTSPQKPYLRAEHAKEIGCGVPLLGIFKQHASFEHDHPPNTSG